MTICWHKNAMILFENVITEAIAMSWKLARWSNWLKINHKPLQPYANLVKSTGIFLDAVKRLYHKFEFVLNYLVCESRYSSDTQLESTKTPVSAKICKSTAQRKLLKRFEQRIDSNRTQYREKALFTFLS